MALEQNKPIEAKDVTDKLDEKVDKSSILTYDDIIASTPPIDLDSAVASAGALKDSEIKFLNISMDTQLLGNGYYNLRLDLPPDMKELITCLPLAMRPNESWNTEYNIYQYTKDSVSFRIKDSSVSQIYTIYYTVIYK